MSMFGGNTDWMRGLQSLFAQYPQGSSWGGQQEPLPSRYAGNWSSVTSTFADPWGSQQAQQAKQQARIPTYGQALAGGAAADFARGEQARQQELGMYMGLLGNLMGSMQGAGQMVQDVRAAQPKGWQMMQRQAQNMREAANQGAKYFDLAKKQMESALGETRQRFGESIGTLQQSRAGFDVGRRDDTAANVMGIQQQYKNQIDSIARRDDLTDEQKGLMQDELKQSMRQQSSAMAAQADAQARQTMLGLDQNIAQMQAQAAQDIGQLGFGVGQTLGQLGMQSAAQRQQAEENISNFYNNMYQYNTSMLQGAQAAALNYALQGNQTMASIINASPFGPTSIFGTIAHMIQAVDEDRSNPFSPQMARMFGGLR